ncbi:MAG: hypothetical protein F2667_02105 [Actinobacteria bacterium]|uniref:Unannotated protein n=1 Tax=freshwater metagenome TaxID=449393 RepID=A0A6J6P202_9ZZZZ|nr:hypothetical protein [Actinomycetota bacterium]
MSQRLTGSLLGLALATGATVATVAIGSPSSAADPEPFVVVGTSDVFDSFLTQTVLEPGFEKAYPQYDFQYVSRGTGAAITYAQAGTADAMIVHAAALENQFVAAGYSDEEYGRAIFWGDYVLLGPADDPAGVLASAPHDIAGAFARIAAAGAAGTANFVSRGGTPGTTVQEHAIWALTTGTTTCTVSAANGGGASPSTSTGSCANPIALPSWYHATGLTQGPNILNGDVCNYDGGGCYVFTDRGTYNYRASKGQITRLGIVTRDNDAAAPGGVPLLINSFHAYALSPEKFADSPNVDINNEAALLFLDWVTSPETQQAIGAYLNESADPPFLPSAAPSLTLDDPLPTTVKAGERISVGATLANVTPGTPALDGVLVKLLATPPGDPTGAPVLVSAGTTDGEGHVTIGYRPQADATYTLDVGPITKVEDATLDPVFGDLLAPTSLTIGQVEVQGRLQDVARSISGGRLTLTGVLAPVVPAGDTGQLVLLAAQGQRELKPVGTQVVRAGAKKFDVTVRLGAGTWRYRLQYVNVGVIRTAQTSVRSVTLS